MNYQKAMMLAKYYLTYLGGGRGEHGVAIILDQEMARRVVLSKSMEID